MGWIGIYTMQIQREGWTSHLLPTPGRHLARAYFAQRPAMRQRPHPITDKFLDQIAPATHASSTLKGPFVPIILRHLKWRERHITVGAHHGRRESWEVFDFASRHIKPIIIPVAPLVAGVGHQFHNFRRSLPSPRRKGARSKLCNLISYFPFLPVQAIVRCQLVNLHFEPP